MVGGRASEVLPLQKVGAGGTKSLRHAKGGGGGGGHNKFCDSFNLGA